ncbi:MAG: gliding motility lipoprotein GldH [Cytophagales bacterium]|nr:gliding motility lipoprotein GldH [Cytophaga sp.]
MKVFVLFASCFVSILSSCTDPDIITEAKIDTSDDSWIQKEEMSFPVHVEDPSATYRIFYQMRYNTDYPYYNLWVNRFLYNEKGDLISKKLQGMELFNGTTGEPYGAGFGNYFDYKILSDSLYHFPSKGTYTIKIEQYMRQDTLKGVASVGVQVIKNTK